jgi:alpha-glucosidase
MRDILSAYTWLTGRMSPPPLWSLGYHQCRWFAYTQPKVVELAAKLRDKELPCDVIWLDIDHMDGYRVFTWDRERFPDPEGMLAGLGDDGFRVVTIVDPGVKFEPGYPVFDEAVRRDVLCRTEGGAIYLGQVWPGRTAFPDFVTAEARKWRGELNAAHVRSGLAGIWNDMNEPATGDIPDRAMRFGRGEFPHERYHNEYALLMAMGTVDGLLAAMPDKRSISSGTICSWHRFSRRVAPPARCICPKAHGITGTRGKNSPDAGMSSRKRPWTSSRFTPAAAR